VLAVRVRLPMVTVPEGDHDTASALVCGWKAVHPARKEGGATSLPIRLIRFGDLNQLGRGTPLQRRSP